MAKVFSQQPQTFQLTYIPWVNMFKKVCVTYLKQWLKLKIHAIAFQFQNKMKT
ncbi:Uncharacterised protein [Mycobacteroides abscessus]|nr:Uncharacterised protein [Mycobacteroides abscessus]